MSKAYSYYKLLITDFRRNNSQVNYANIAEFRIYDKDGTNLARQDGVEYSASSDLPPNGAVQCAFDENTSTVWHSVYQGSLASYTNWLQVKLPEPVRAVSIGIILGNGSFADFINTFCLYGSTDGTTWDVLLEQSDIYSGWSIRVERLFVLPGPEKRYLIQDATTIYTVTDSVLEDLQTTDLTAGLFQTHGMEDPPTSEILLTLNNPKVLAWSDEEQPEITATVMATPYPQTIYSPEYDMTDPTILGIEKVIAVASEDVMFAVSFDGGETWKYYTGTDWATLSEETSGMSAETIMSVPTDKWSEVATTGTFKVRATLPSVESTLSSFIVDYLNA